MTNFKQIVIGLTLTTGLLSSPVLFAAAPVVDGEDVRNNRASNASASQTSGQQPQNNVSQQSQIIGELVLQMQQLQQEVRQLRGQLEEQDYLIQQLTSQQRDLYLDVDRRLQDISSGAVKPTQASSGSGSNSNPAGQAKPSSAAQDAYNQAFALLKAKQFSEAKSSFQAFLQTHSNDPLASNGHYWLGQLYFNENRLEEASKQFKAVYADNPKAPKKDVAMLKVGQILEKQGDKQSAKTTYSQVAKLFPNTTAGKLAKKKADTL